METLTELVDGLGWLVEASDAELEEKKTTKDRRQADTLASRVLPLKDWVCLRYLLRPAQYSNTKFDVDNDNGLLFANRWLSVSKLNLVMIYRTGLRFTAYYILYL